MEKVKFALILSAVLIGTQAGARERVYGTQTYYSYSIDPITDVNKSVVTLYEVNDLVGDSALVLRCTSFDLPQKWLYLQSKHALVDPFPTNSDGLPDIVMRLGTDAPINISPTALNTVVDRDNDVNPNALAITGGTFQQIVNGLSSGKKLVIRAYRESGGQPLTYTFSPNGFNTAWNAIRGCGYSSAPSTPQASTPVNSSGGSAPKFTQWYFTTCRNAGNGSVRTGLLAGQAHLCDLVIETIPNGVSPVSATFKYELEYVQGGQKGKLNLDSVDTWNADGSGNVKRFVQSGNKLIFTLPLNVRARAERTYTSINVTANIRFSNGSSKKVYEPLPIR